MGRSRSLSGIAQAERAVRREFYPRRFLSFRFLAVKNEIRSGGWLLGEAGETVSEKSAADFL